MIEYPIQVYINFTKKCNLKCKHCYSDSSSGNDINIDRLADVINKIDPIKIVISGGEPLLVYKKIEKFILLLKNKPVITLITNGTIYQKDVGIFINRFIDELVISLDTLNKNVLNSIRGKVKIEDIFTNIGYLKKVNNNIKINFVLFHENIKDLEEVIFFAKKNKINKIGILRQRNIGRSKEVFNLKELESFYRNAAKLSRSAKIKLEIHDPIINKFKIKGLKNYCYAADKIVSIDTNLNFKPCPLVDFKMKGNFDRIWNSKVFKSYRNKSRCF